MIIFEEDCVSQSCTALVICKHIHDKSQVQAGKKVNK